MQLQPIWLMLITWTQWTKVDCGHKIDYGRPAMFLSLPLLNTCSSRRIFSNTFLIHKQLCLEIVSTTFLLVCFVCLKHYKISFFIKNSIKKRPGNYFHTFFWIFKGTAVIKETVEASMLIWANFDSFAIRYLI